MAHASLARDFLQPHRIGPVDGEGATSGREDVFTRLGRAAPNPPPLARWLVGSVTSLCFHTLNLNLGDLLRTPALNYGNLFSDT